MKTLHFFGRLTVDMLICKLHKFEIFSKPLRSNTVIQSCGLKISVKNQYPLRSGINQKTPKNKKYEKKLQRYILFQKSI